LKSRPIAAWLRRVGKWLFATALNHALRRVGAAVAGLAENYFAGDLPLILGIGSGEPGALRRDFPAALPFLSRGINHVAGSLRLARTIKV